MRPQPSYVNPSNQASPGRVFSCRLVAGIPPTTQGRQGWHANLAFSSFQAYRVHCVAPGAAAALPSPTLTDKCGHHTQNLGGAVHPAITNPRQTSLPLSEMARPSWQICMQNVFGTLSVQSAHGTSKHSSCSYSGLLRTTESVSDSRRDEGSIQQR